MYDIDIGIDKWAIESKFKPPKLSRILRNVIYDGSNIIKIRGNMNYLKDNVEKIIICKKIEIETAPHRVYKNQF